jgi:hypothetical protein
MGKIWMVLMLASAGVSLVCGRGGEAAEALLSSGSQAVELLLTLLPALLFILLALLQKIILLAQGGHFRLCLLAPQGAKQIPYRFPKECFPSAMPRLSQKRESEKGQRMP